MANITYFAHVSCETHLEIVLLLELVVVQFEAAHDRKTGRMAEITKVISAAAHPTAMSLSPSESNAMRMEEDAGATKKKRTEKQIRKRTREEADPKKKNEEQKKEDKG